MIACYSRAATAMPMEVLGIRVEARNTLFRVGSVTKVLTWMGVLQQVEAGRFSLDEDINE